MTFKHRIIALPCLFICLYLFITAWIVCCRKFTMVDFFNFFSISLRKAQKKKKQLSHNTQYTVLCVKTLILACAYVGFFPMLIFQSNVLENSVQLVSTPPYFVLAQFHPRTKEGNEPTPVLWYWLFRELHHTVLSKIQNICIVFLLKII